MNDVKILEKFDVTEAQLDEWEKDAANGIFHGTPRKIVVGRLKQQCKTKSQFSSPYSNSSTLVKTS